MTKKNKAVEVYKAAVAGAALEIMHKPNDENARYSITEYKKTVFFINVINIIVTTLIGFAVVFAVMKIQTPAVETPEYTAEAERVRNVLGIESPAAKNAEKRNYSNSFQDER